jgi:hypothetical protein
LHQSASAQLRDDSKALEQPIEKFRQEMMFNASLTSRQKAAALDQADRRLTPKASARLTSSVNQPSAGMAA